MLPLPVKYFVFPKKYLENLKTFVIFAHRLQNIMRIIAKSTLVDYYSKNPQAKSALEVWHR